jgi:FKBP-type peptidyl-prolyl cis-trans isomerase
MKRTTKLFSLLLIAVLICGCKQENWLDWKLQNELWLQNNAKQEGVITTPTGLQYKCIEKGPGGGARPDEAKTVTIDYEGKMINGYIFDSAEAYSSTVSSFVDGFAEGLKKMNKWDEYEFYIPYDLGYGASGVGTEGTSSFIPPYSTLIFRVHLSSVY